MGATLEIIIAGMIVVAVLLPLVNAFDKWKKEMEQDDENRK